MNTSTSTTHYPAAPTSERVETRTLCVLVDNEPGVLARVIGLFAGRGYNIDSLTVSETEHEKHLSRITIVTRGTPMVLEQIKNQLDRLVPVHRVVDLTTGSPAIQRELAMVKVRGKGKDRAGGARLAEELSTPASSTKPPRATCSKSPARPTRSKASSARCCRSAWSKSRAPAWSPSRAARRGCNRHCGAAKQSSAKMLSLPLSQ